MNQYQTLTQTELITRCLKNDRKAQRVLYESMGPVMKMVCLRYLIDKEMAEDALNKGFLKVFTKLASYQGSGSFEGWVRRIIVNECLDANRAHKPVYAIEEYNLSDTSFAINETDSTHETTYILKLIDALPLGYKTVFNMVEIDGYTHKEVAEKLNITESASRSQLAKAKNNLRQKLST